MNIFQAIENKDVDKVYHLLLYGEANVNELNEKGQTPLIVATIKKQYNIILKLLEYKAKVNLRDNEGKTALWHAVRDPKDHVRQNDWDYDTNIALWNPQTFYDTQTVPLLLKNGANVTLEEDGNELLDMASGENNVINVRELLNYGVNPTPFFIKAITHVGIFGSNRDIRVVEEFLKHNPDVNTVASDGSGNTALIMGCGFLPEIVPKLIARGANVNAKNNKGETALFMLNHPKTLVELLTHGANINIQDNNGNTALMSSIRDRLIDHFVILMKYNPDLTLKNNDGFTALDIAKEDDIDEEYFGKELRLKSEDIVKFNNDHCSICMENYNVGLLCILNPCNHIYHKECMKIISDNKCPKCRQVTTEVKIIRINTIPDELSDQRVFFGGSNIYYDKLQKYINKLKN